MNKWEMKEAKSEFGQLIEAAQQKGPQIVTEYGKKVIVVISFEEYEQIAKPKIDLVAFLKNSPLAYLDLNLTRGQDLPRDIE
ncbi:MAG: type II toxin-antitoxin system Phd/YefM family antitoxin [Chloroflexi bacterium]|nr:type II toxin-antitoxin system Phd/YefM family antitoxin [Chloroflexota bacterium]